MNEKMKVSLAVVIAYSLGILSCYEWLVWKPASTKSALAFQLNDRPIPVLDFKENGDILVHGRKIQNDVDIINGLLFFIEQSKRSSTKEGQTQFSLMPVEKKKK